MLPAWLQAVVQHRQYQCNKKAAGRNAGVQQKFKDCCGQPGRRRGTTWRPLPPVKLKRQVFGWRVCSLSCPNHRNPSQQVRCNQHQCKETFLEPNLFNECHVCMSACTAKVFVTSAAACEVPPLLVTMSPTQPDAGYSKPRA